MLCCFWVSLSHLLSVCGIRFEAQSAPEKGSQPVRLGRLPGWFFVLRLGAPATNEPTNEPTNDPTIIPATREPHYQSCSISMYACICIMHACGEHVDTRQSNRRSYARAGAPGTLWKQRFVLCVPFANAPVDCVSRIVCWIWLGVVVEMCVGLVNRFFFLCWCAACCSSILAVCVSGEKTLLAPKNYISSAGATAPLY